MDPLHRLTAPSATDILNNYIQTACFIINLFDAILQPRLQELCVDVAYL